MKKRNFISSMILLVFAFTACKKDNIETSKALNPVEFNLNANDFSDDSGLKSASLTNVKSALVSIANAQGVIVYESEKLELTVFNDVYLSNKLLLEVGNYNVTNFLLLDEDDNVVYVTPKEDSKFANLVNDPLAINFNVNLNQTTTVSPEVISIKNYNPADFGYVEFGFSYIKTFNFVMGIYEANNINSKVATDANLTIQANDKELVNKQIDGILNLITVNDGLKGYIISVKKDGYKTYNKTFTCDELKEYVKTPLDVILEKNDTKKISDAYICDYYKTEKFGDNPFLQAFSWTFSGKNTNCRFLMDFDLSDISSGTKIKAAKLSLFYADNHPDNMHPGFFGGDNSIKIELVTSTWDENTVTWNNQPSTTTAGAIYLPADNNGKVDKTDIDITSFIQKMIDKPDQTFGIRISMAVEQRYCSSFFASSENAMVDKRPELKIEL